MGRVPEELILLSAALVLALRGERAIAPRVATAAEVRAAMISNGHLFVPLATQPMSAQGLSSPANRAVLAEMRDNPGTLALVRYIAECALRPDQQVALPEGLEGSFTGRVGLAPEWADGPCDETCQEWVSACLYARTNLYTISVNISLRGDHPAFRALPRVTSDFVEEGAFYGNYFVSPPRQYACTGRGFEPYLQAFRVCSLPDQRCGFQHVGACSDLDGVTGARATRIACSGAPDADGAYTECFTRATRDDGSRPTPNTSYRHVVSVFLQRVEGTVVASTGDGP